MGYEIIEGDCIEAMRGMPDASVDAVICDPPYGTTACKWDSVIPFAPMWEQLKRITKPRAAIVLFASQPFTSALVMSNPAMFRYAIVWDKALTVGYLNAKKRPLSRHEDICVFSEGQETYNPQMALRDTTRSSLSGRDSPVYGTSKEAIRTYTHRYPTSVVPISNAVRIGRTHPTQKPVALMEYLIRTYTNEGETVLDFTAGSGSTGVACVNTGRSFIGIEREPAYVEIARRRIADASQQPKLEGVA